MRRAQLLVVLMAVFLLSGLAGVAVGGQAALAGWWLVGVSLVFLLVGIVALRRESAGR